MVETSGGRWPHWDTPNVKDNLDKQLNETSPLTNAMTLNEITKLVLPIFPNAVILPNNYGCWVVYTDIKEKK